MAIYYIGKGLCKVAKSAGLVAFGVMGGVVLTAVGLIWTSDEDFGKGVQGFRELRNVRKNLEY